MSRRGLKSFGDVITAYIRDYRDDKRERLGFYRNLPSRQAVLGIVGSWKDKDGHCPSHQRRVPREAKAKAGRLIRSARLNGVRSFEALEVKVGSLIGRVRGIGPTTVYDVSLAIGAKFGLEPELIYLHAGTLDGARAIGLSVRGLRVLPMDAFPSAFRRLRPYEVEDCLCIYKHELRGIAEALRR